MPFASPLAPRSTSLTRRCFSSLAARWSPRLRPLLLHALLDLACSRGPGARPWRRADGGTRGVHRDGADGGWQSLAHLCSSASALPAGAPRTISGAPPRTASGHLPARRHGLEDVRRQVSSRPGHAAGRRHVEAAFVPPRPRRLAGIVNKKKKSKITVLWFCTS